MGSGSTGYGGGGGGYFRAIMKFYHDIVEAHYNVHELRRFSLLEL